MKSIWPTAVAQSFDILFDEFDETLRTCPDTLWERSMWDVSADRGAWSPQPPTLPNGDPDPRGVQVYSMFWHVAYHSLFVLDWNLSERDPGWAPPAPFGKHDLDAGALPPRTYSRSELLNYLDFDRTKTLNILEGLSDEDGGRLWATELRGSRPLLSVRMVNNLAHTIDHHATLAMFVWQHRK